MLFFFFGLFLPHTHTLTHTLTRSHTLTHTHTHTHAQHTQKSLYLRGKSMAFTFDHTIYSLAHLLTCSHAQEILDAMEGGVAPLPSAAVLGNPSNREHAEYIRVSE